MWQLDNHIESPDLYIGVIKHRKLSTGAEKPMPRTCIAYHGVVGYDIKLFLCRCSASNVNFSLILWIRLKNFIKKTELVGRYFATTTF